MRAWAPALLACLVRLVEAKDASRCHRNIPSSPRRARHHGAESRQASARRPIDLATSRSYSRWQHARAHRCESPGRQSLHDPRSELRKQVRPASRACPSAVDRGRPPNVGGGSKRAAGHPSPDTTRERWTRSRPRLERVDQRHFFHMRAQRRSRVRAERTRSGRGRGSSAPWPNAPHSVLVQSQSARLASSSQSMSNAVFTAAASCA